MIRLVPSGLSEQEIVPYETCLPPGERVLVLSPHPDDETLGCGGTLSMLVRMGREVRVVFMTRGEKAAPSAEDPDAYARVREKEAGMAMKALGISRYDFLRFSDRELDRMVQKAIEDVHAVCRNFSPDIVYSPSPVELHPDHRATAMIAMEVMNVLNIGVVFYELITPIRPNCIVDISGVFKFKERAIKAYKSQMKLLDYLKLFRALNTYRSFTLVGSARYAEVFWVVRNTGKEEMIRWLSYQSPLQPDKSLVQTRPTQE